MCVAPSEFQGKQRVWREGHLSWRWLLPPGYVSGSVETLQSGQSERLKVSWKSYRTIRLLFNRGGKKMREKKFSAESFLLVFN